MNKSKVFMIISIIVLILSIGGSLAWYSWVSTNNTSVSLGFCIPEISFIGGDTLNGNGLVPVTDKENGIRKQIDVYLNKTCKEGDSGVMNLYMRIDILPEELKEETFVYEIVKDNEILYSNNFKDNKEGDVIELLTNEVITEDDSIYQIFKKEFGEKLLDNNQYRYSYSGKENRFLSDIKIERPNHNYQLALEYLSSLYILSKCKYFIGGRCGGSTVAWIWQNCWEDLYIWKLGYYGKGFKNRLFAKLTQRKNEGDYVVYYILGIKFKFQAKNKNKK